MIIISPYSRALRSGKMNPKNYPYWKEIVSAFKNEIVQLTIDGEEKLTDNVRNHLSLKDVKSLIKDCRFWISVDNFLPHLAHHVKKPGVVLFGMSDPNIFGYPENLNLLKDRKHLRENQFDMWENYTYNGEVFLPAKDVIVKIKERFV